MTSTDSLATDRVFKRTLVGPFKFLRVDAHSEWKCCRCGHAGTLSTPVLVDWCDRASAGEQRIATDGVRCVSCDALEMLQLPVLQYRRADGIGLLVGLPVAGANRESEAWIRDTLLAASAESPDCGPAPSLDGADVVVTVPATWWGAVWNQPLAPRLLGILPFAIDESTEEIERWRAEALQIIGFPSIDSDVVEFLSAESREAALEVVSARPELLSVRWALTVDVLLAQHRMRQETPEAADVIDTRAAVLSQARMFSVEGVRELVADKARLPLIEAAGAAIDPPSRLRVLARAVEADGPAMSPLRVVAQNSYVQALHGDAARSPAADQRLLSASERAVEVAAGVLGEEHPLTLGAEVNHAVCVEERAENDAKGLEEARAILDRLAPRAARAATVAMVDVAINYAAIASRGAGTFADNPETASDLLADAAHIGGLLSLDDRRARLTILVDGAAALRSRQSGSRRENASRAVALLEEASALDGEWKILSLPERVLVSMNRSNAITQLYEWSAAGVEAEDVRGAARETIELCGDLNRLHAVSIQARSNAGASLHTAYIRVRDERSNWQEAHGVLVDALAAAGEAFSRHHPVALHVALHLAAVCGCAIDGEVVDSARAAALFEMIIEHAQDERLRMTAASNLAQLRTGEGDWLNAASGFATAAEAKSALLHRARSLPGRLGVISSVPDLAAREALALVLAKSPAEAIETLEAGRVRLTNRATPEPGANTNATAIIHLATCDLGTAGILRLPDGELRTFASALTSGLLKPLLAAVLAAKQRDSRRESLDELLAPLAAGVIGPANSLLADADVEELVVVACGTLTSCPLHAVAAEADATWAERYTVRYRITADRADVPALSDAKVVAVIGEGVPFASADGMAVQAWAAAVEQPPDGVDPARWLMRELPGASVAHLACHGLCNSEDPMRSAFQLGSSSELTVADIAGIATPRLALVVAPACQSAAAGPGAPDELLGVGHALAHAGAGTVVASLWNAEDATTALVVSRFYRELAVSGDPAHALTLAERFVAALTGPELAALARDRLHDVPTASWLPYDLAVEFSALTVHPDFRDPETRCFGHPAQWATLSCLEA